MLGETDRHRQLTVDRWRQHDGVRRASDPIQSGRGDVGCGAGAGTLLRVAEGEVRKDLPDDRLILCHGLAREHELAKVQRRWWPQRETHIVGVGSGRLHPRRRGRSVVKSVAG